MVFQPLQGDGFWLHIWLCSLTSSRVCMYIRTYVRTHICPCAYVHDVCSCYIRKFMHTKKKGAHVGTLLTLDIEMYTFVWKLLRTFISLMMWYVHVHGACPGVQDTVNFFSPCLSTVLCRFVRLNSFSLGSGRAVNLLTYWLLPSTATNLVNTLPLLSLE